MSAEVDFPPLRFGIIGAGNIAKTHAAAIRASDRAILVGVAGGRSSESLAGQESCRWYPSGEELLQAQDVDVVDICTPSGARLELAERAAVARKHVLVEKPMEVTLERGQRMIDACQENGVHLGVIYQSRLKPGNAATREAISRGAVGAVVFGDAAVKWHRPPDYYRTGAWRGTWALDGGGALMNQAIHTVDLLLWFLGDARRVYAKAGNRLHRAIEVEDTLLAHIEFESGAFGSIAATTAAFPGSARRVEVHGTEGTVQLVDDNVSGWEVRSGFLAPIDQLSTASEGAKTHVVADAEWHRLQIEDMVEAVHRCRTPLVDGAEGMRSLRLVCAAYESAKRGEPVELAELGP